MSVAKLHQGVLIRQVLSRKRKVRLTFVPDDPSRATDSDSVNRINDDGEKRSWSHLLGDPKGVDIDTGITVLRFNTDNESGIAFFMPGKSTLPTIRKLFHQTGTPGGGPVASLAQFNQCLADRRNAVSAAEFNFWGAVSGCAPLLRQPG